MVFAPFGKGKGIKTWPSRKAYLREYLAFLRASTSKGIPSGKAALRWYIQNKPNVSFSEVRAEILRIERSKRIGEEIGERIWEYIRKTRNPPPKKPTKPKLRRIK